MVRSGLLSDPGEITAVVSKLLCEHLRADRCSYAEINVENGHVDIVGNYSATLPGILGRYPVASFGPQFLATMKTGRPYMFRGNCWLVSITIALMPPLLST